MARHRGRLAVIIAAVVVVLAVTVGVLVGVPRPGAPASAPTPSPTADGTGEATSPEPEPTPTLTPSPVLGAAEDGPAVDADRLGDRLAAVPRSGVGQVAGVVVDVEDGTVIHDGGAGTAMTPASTIKLLTTGAALAAYGPEHRFATRVVDSAAGGIVLVGGGDPYLRTEPDPDDEFASLTDLADETAEALTADGRNSIALGYDAGLFAGPAWNPTWPAGYAREVAPTAALWVDGARTDGVNPGPRDADPPRAAAETFAELLVDRGITVTAVAPATSAGDADEIAEVESATLAVIVESVLRFSDNDAAEVLFRQVSVAGDGDGSIGDAQRAVAARLVDAGILSDVSAVGRIVDGSGMSRANAIPPRAVASVVTAALAEDRTELTPIRSGLPTAGGDGSLRQRFDASGTDDGLGVVRAKTGTLTGRHGLAGYARTDSGRLLAFAFLITGGDAYADRVYLDRVTAALAGCGCS